jgi:HSP20 family molecular chaperone IbpA
VPTLTAWQSQIGRREVDISEDDRGYLLKADLPEMKKDR